jgi:hypothetical protein
MVVVVLSGPTTEPSVSVTVSVVAPSLLMTVSSVSDWSMTPSPFQSYVVVRSSPSAEVVVVICSASWPSAV